MPTTTSRSLPTGTVTFLFTDIEGSTRLLASLGEAYEPLLSTHARLLRACFEAHGGVEVSTEGDAFFVAFPSATEAIAAVVAAQRALAEEAWPDGGVIRVRMGLHTGEGRLGGDNYSGLDINRAARIAASGHGGQVVLSDATRSLIGAALPDAVLLRDMGSHGLKDLPEPEHLWQLDIAGLQTEFPALKTAEERRGDLPAIASSLVGREAEVAEVREHLKSRSLVTLTGPGGTGKTRLALSVAQAEQISYPDGAWFIDLAQATDRAAVASAIALVLGVREAPDRDFEDGLKVFLRERRLLLVLDNFEQALEAAPLLSALLADAPGLRIIATSRSALRLRGEQEYGVPPLAGSESVTLFVARASDVRKDFELNDENADAVATICERLDGLPLAIELAAVRVRLLSPQAILDRLAKRLPLLKGGGRDRPERQQTLAGTIDWSYDLLEEPERQLFARLSVFAGGWSLESAEQVCDPSGDLGLDVFESLSALVEKSLVRLTSEAADEPRFAMLQVIREYASERLAEDPAAEDVVRRHAEAMMELVEGAAPELTRVDLREWQRRLRLEEDNVRAALRWAVDGGHTEVGLRIAGSLWRFWQYWAQVKEGISWLSAVLELPEASALPTARASTLTGLASLLYWSGDLDRSNELYAEVVEIRRDLGDPDLLAQALTDAMWGAVGSSQMALAMERAEQALLLFEQAGNEAGAATVLALKRTVEVMSGQGGTLESAIEATANAAVVNRRVGQIHNASESLAMLARTERLSGRYDAARQHLREGLSLFYELGNAGRLPGVFKVFAALELATGHPDRAVRLGAAAARYSEEIGGELSESILRAGDPVEEARADLTDEHHAREYELGRSMTIDEVVEYALAGSAV